MQKFIIRWNSGFNDGKGSLLIEAADGQDQAEFYAEGQCIHEFESNRVFSAEPDSPAARKRNGIALDALPSVTLEAEPTMEGMDFISQFKDGFAKKKEVS